MSVANAKDQAADADVRRIRRRGRQRRDRFEAIAISTLWWRLLKVIGDREPVEPALICESPQPSHLIERTAEVTDVYPEPSSRSPIMGSLAGREGIAWVDPSAGSSQARAPPSPVPRTCTRRQLRRCPRCRRPQARDRRAETRGA